MDGDKYVFLIKTNDGYSMRNVLGSIRYLNVKANLILYPDRVEISQSNSDNDVLCNAIINSDRLLEYQYNVVGNDGKKLQRASAGFKTVDLMRNTKVSKRDGIVIYMIAGNPNIHIQPSLSATSCAYVLNQEVDQITYDLPQYTRSKTDPNVRIPNNDFAKMCNSIIGLKGKHVEVIGYKYGIEFKAILQTGKPAHITPFGKIPKPDEIKSSDTWTMTIRVPTLKIVSKLNNFNTNGLILVYFEPKLPLKINTLIGGYGEVTYYYRDVTV